jgi:hypothetical protein
LRSTAPDSTWGFFEGMGAQDAPIPKDRRKHTKTDTMKKFLISLLLAFGLGSSAIAQQTPPAPTALPASGLGVNYVYTNPSGHSTPYQLYFSKNGLFYAVFDPSVSASDFSETFRFSVAFAGPMLPSGAVLQPLVVPSVVSTNFVTQETRVSVPFVVANSTTLQTIPFSVATNLQAGSHYRFEARLYLNTGSGGSKIDVGGTCNTSNFVAHYTGWGTSTTVLYAGNLTSFLSGPSGSSTAGAFVLIEGELDVTNGGTFVIQFAENGSNATPSVVLAGSTLTVIQVP